MAERIAKFIARSGVCSRRQAEESARRHLVYPGLRRVADRVARIGAGAVYRAACGDRRSRNRGGHGHPARRSLSPSPRRFFRGQGSLPRRIFRGGRQGRLLASERGDRPLVTGLPCAL